MDAATLHVLVKLAIGLIVFVTLLSVGTLWAANGKPLLPADGIGGGDTESDDNVI